MDFRWFSPDFTAAMLVYRTIEENVFWEFDSIIMQNMCHNLLLFCTQTWPSHHVIENHLLKIKTSMRNKKDLLFIANRNAVKHKKKKAKEMVNKYAVSYYLTVFGLE